MATKISVDPQKLLGFAPDLDPSTPGIFQACTNVFPTTTGFKGAPSPVNAGLSALDGKVYGAAMMNLLDGTARMFAGTKTKLYEDVEGAWVDRSAPEGYELGTDGKWRYAAFGNACLAVNGQTVMQSSLGGEFTDVPVSVSAINIVNPGSGYTSTPSITIGPPDIVTGVQATATAVVSGVISAANITAAGLGYGVAPNITVNPDSTLQTGSSAVMLSTITGVVTELFTYSGYNGSGYSSVPTVSITGGGGTGATAKCILGTTAVGTAVLSGGTVASVALTNNTWSANTMTGVGVGSVSGAGYTSVPTVTFSAPTSGTTATGTALVCLMPNNSYSVVGIKITNAGSGYTSAPTVTISAPATLNQVVGFEVTNPGSGYTTVPTVQLIGGSPLVPAYVTCNICGTLTSASVSNGGSGYSGTPTAVVDAPGIINGAIAAGINTAGAVSVLTIISPGAGFTVAPTLTISGGGGSGATATCTINSMGFINSVTLTNGGSGYTSNPTVSFTSQPSVSTTTAKVTLTTSQTLTGITITNVGSGYYNTPTVSITGGGASGSNTGTATATLTEAPIGEIIFVANGQVFNCNCSYPPQVAGGDFWFASGLYDYTQWDASNMQTLCAYGQLIDTPGPITAGASIGPNAIVFKKNSMYLGTQTGYPVGWDFQAVSKDVGALNQECVVTVENTLYFIGPNDFFAYQGYGLPVEIGENVRRWFFNQLNPDYVNNICSFYDADQKVIYWAFPSTSSDDGSVDSCICYNWVTKTWGSLDTNIECFVTIVNGEITYDGLGAEWNTYNDLPQISYNSSFWINFRTTPGYFDSTNTLFALAGSSVNSSITTNAFGDDQSYSSMQQFRIRFKQQPTSGSALWQGKTTLGSDDPSIITNVNTGPLVLGDSRIDVDQTNRWHNLILTLNGDYEAMEWYPSMVMLGKN